MLPPTNITVDPHTSLLLDILSTLQHRSHQRTILSSPYNTLNTGSMGDNLTLMTTTAEANTASVTENDDDDDDSDLEGPP